MRALRGGDRVSQNDGFVVVQQLEFADTIVVSDEERPPNSGVIVSRRQGHPARQTVVTPIITSRRAPASRGAWLRAVWFGAFAMVVTATATAFLLEPSAQDTPTFQSR